MDRQLIPARGDAADADNVTRGWKTDLRTGATEIGVAGDWICQCGYPIDHDDDDGFMKLYPGSYPTDKHADDRFSLIPGRFYVWASEIQDGQVVATDYAPDTGWLEVSGPWASVIQDGRVVATDYAPDVGWLDVGVQTPPNAPGESPSP